MNGSCWKLNQFEIRSIFLNRKSQEHVQQQQHWRYTALSPFMTPKKCLFFFSLYKAQLKQSSLTIKHHSTQNPPKDSNCFLDQSCDCHSQMVSFTFYLLSESNWKCQPYLLNVTNSIFTAPKNLPLDKLWDKFPFLSLPHFLLSQA